MARQRNAVRSYIIPATLSVVAGGAVAVSTATLPLGYGFMLQELRVAAPEEMHAAVSVRSAGLSREPISEPLPEELIHSNPVIARGPNSVLPLDIPFLPGDSLVFSATATAAGSVAICAAGILIPQDTLEMWGQNAR